MLFVGEKDILVLDFDHIKQEDKKYNISVLIHKGISLDTIKKEMEICQVLCANCHRRKTSKERQTRKYKWLLKIDEK